MHTDNNNEKPDGPRPLNAKRAADPMMIPMMVRDVGGSAELGVMLERIRNLGSCAAPPPSAELAALMANGLPGKSPSRRRTSFHNRALLCAILVSIMGGTAAGAAFADDTFRNSAQVVIANVINALTPHDLPTLQPAPPQPTQAGEHPSPLPEPRPAKPTTTDPVNKDVDDGGASRPDSSNPDTGPTNPDSGQTLAPKPPDGPASDPILSTSGEGSSTGSSDTGKAGTPDSPESPDGVDTQN